MSEYSSSSESTSEATVSQSSNEESYCECKGYEISDDEVSDMKYHVFISKTASQYIADYIRPEYWGSEYNLLYKYLDYIWRFQLIDKMVKQIQFKDKTRLIFHTGLISKTDSEPLYLCLLPNNQNKKHWKVVCGNEIQAEYNSCLRKIDLIQIYKMCEHDIPVKTDFLKNKTNIMFHSNYLIYVDFQERIRTSKLRILEFLQREANFDKFLSSKELESLIMLGTKEAICRVKNDPNLVGKQVFVERESVNKKKVTIGYHLELLLPIMLRVNNNDVYFALVLRPNHNKKHYFGMSIITRDMAYSNARLISEVKLSWLKPKKYVINCIKTMQNNNNNNNDNTENISDKIVKNNYDKNMLSEYNFAGFDLHEKCDIFGPKIEINPFFYLATVLPLKLPKLSSSK